MAFKLHSITCDVGIEPNQATEIKRLATSVFEAWKKQFGLSNTARLSETQGVRGHVLQYTGGQSGAAVYGLDFFTTENDAALIGFVAKRHQGMGGANLASHERATVKRLSASTAQIFS